MKGKIDIIFQGGQVFGIRDEGGYLVFFPKVTKYEGQETRYKNQVMKFRKLALTIKKAIENEK